MLASALASQSREQPRSPPPARYVVGRVVGRKIAFPQISGEKSRARPASPRSRPTSPVNGAGGITGCRDDSEPPELGPAALKNFRTRLSDRSAREPLPSGPVVPATT